MLCPRPPWQQSRTTPYLTQRRSEPDGKLRIHFDPGSRYAYSGEGLVLLQFDGPQGRGFFKGGHNDTTGNTWVCVERRKRCVVILANDVRAERAFPHLAAFAIGETGVPWNWEYGAMEAWRPMSTAAGGR